MPSYDMICNECGNELEVFRSIANRDAALACPGCGSPMVRVIGTMALIGAQPSKPIDLTKQLGRTFETNREYREYLATAGVKETDKASMRPTIDKIQDSKDKKAKRDGYKDWRHRCAEIRKKASIG